MEAFEAAKIVYNRILETETKTITRKIMGYIYLQDHADRQMIRLAFGPDNSIRTLIQKSKTELNLDPKPVSSPSLQFDPTSFQIRPAMLHYQNHDQFVGLNDQFEPFSQEITNYPQNCYTDDGNSRVRGRRDGNSTKTCHYFNKGYCKHGNNCKFVHTQSDLEHNSNEFDDQSAISPDSLEKLEFEITEILKSRRGNPVSIASLPMVYYDRYGRTLQAEGYLTESQRHGKAGYSLTKLLARLKNRIRLIDRPNGQHSVILAEDASMYMENSYDRNNTNPGPIVNGSKQIYLTFPAESTFTEDDAASYFSTFGLVENVRIPFQEKRMFGFVTFHNPETVQMILSKGNPHYIRDARVLVKPYREKLKLFDRKCFEILEGPMCYHSHSTNMDQDSRTRLEPSRMFQRQLVEDHELAVQLETLHLSQLQLTREPSYLETTFDDQKPLEDQADNFNFQSLRLVTRLLDQDKYDTLAYHRS